jgi:imidazolonepropionase-like amidohydrolase
LGFGCDLGSGIWGLARRAAALAVIVSAATYLSASPQHASDGSVLITGGTLIDGTGAPPRPNGGVLIVGGRIVTAGSDAAKRAPADVRRFDAAGKWIVPGLIDGHVHFFQTGGLDARPDIVPHPTGRSYPDVVNAIRQQPEPYLWSYICSGITAVVDPGGPMWGFELRDRRAQDPRAPRIAFSGPLLATADPPALELGNDDPIWLMKDAAAIPAMVERLASQRPDMIKIWFVHRRSDDLAAQSSLVRAAIAAIHARSLRAAVHATTLETARVAVDAGADILVHGVGDVEVDAAFVNAVVSKRVIYVPTLIVGKSYREVRLRSIGLEEFERRCAPASSVESFAVLPDLHDSILSRNPTLGPDQLPTQQRNLKKLVDAGTLIAAGTDAGNTRTLHGPSLHREFVLMLAAGMSPMQILTSATRNGARLFGRDDLGQVAAGMQADLVVLDADPLADIHNTRRVRATIRGGTIHEAR